MRPTICHTGMLLPLPEREQAYWKEIQDNINKADTLLLQDKERQSKWSKASMCICQSTGARFYQSTKATGHTLKNGLKVLYYHNDNVPSIKMKLDLAADYWYEPTDKAPLFDLTCKMLLEGTKTYTKEQLLSEMEKRGVTIQIKIDGTISIASSPQEIQKACELCADIIANPLFTQENLDKLKKRAIATYMKFWDTPASIMAYLMGKHLYEEEGFFHNPVGTPESIERITLEDITSFHAKYYSSDGATLAVVGDLSNINIIEILESALGTWPGPQIIKRAKCTGTSKKSEHEIIHTIEREQVLLGFIGHSVPYGHADYYALLLFNSMFNHKLFDLRQKMNGIYWIQGSVIEGSVDNNEPREVWIKTQVAQTRVQETQKLILDTIETLADSFDEEDLLNAQHAIAHNINRRYSTNFQLQVPFYF